MEHAITMEKTVTELTLDHDHCTFSTGIDGSLTAGQGKLDDMGYFAVPCPECAARMRKKIDGHTNQVVALVERLFANSH